jgi:hypothetical protein
VITLAEIPFSQARQLALAVSGCTGSILVPSILRPTTDQCSLHDPDVQQALNDLRRAVTNLLVENGHASAEGAPCTLIPLPSNSAPRELTSHRVNGVNEKLRVLAVDPPGPGGASHDYVVLIPLASRFAVGQDWTKTILSMSGSQELCWWPMHNLATITEWKDGKSISAPYSVQRITFQNGPIKDSGVNGNTQEALLAILLDRLEGFQSGQYACHDNQMALDHLQITRLVLHKRTMDRTARGVEGTLKK